MIHVAKPDEMLWICSMGKQFRVRAIADTESEINKFMETHRDTGLIACFGPLNIVADLYAGINK